MKDSRHMREGLLTIAILTMALVVASCSPDESSTSGPSSSAIPARASPGGAVSPVDPYTNILKEDYVGPETCGKCHEKNYSTWKLHPHSRMNSLASDASVLGDFTGTRLPYAEGAVMFRKDKGRYLMEYFQGGKPVRSFRVTRTIGWRYLQEYVGVQTEGPEPKEDPLYTEETRLKFGYLLKERRWLPQSYFDAPNVNPEYRDDGVLTYDPFVPDRTPFNTQCIHCHNTFPYELRLYTSERLIGFPPAPALAIDALLASRPGYHEQLHNPYLATQALVSVGISCESCHFGGREHSRDLKTPVRFVPTHPALMGWTPSPLNARKNPAVVNSLCRQCHFSQSGSWADGSALLNSMEAIDQDHGACKSQLRCTDCHNPHVRGPDAGSPVQPDHLEACMRCHERYRTPEAIRAHSLHDAAQVSCLDCHMPRIVQGFDVMNRTHRISSPTEHGILDSGMPNACNLCHLDRSLAWTRDELQKGWKKRLELPEGLQDVFGKGCARPAGESWLSQPVGLLRAIAGAAFARSPLAKQSLPRLLEALDEPNGYLRHRALENVERVLGRQLEATEYVVTAAPADRRAQVERLLKQYR